MNRLGLSSSLLFCSWSLVFAAGCASEPSAEAPGPAPRSSPAPSPGRLALQFAPGNHPVERRIAELQVRLQRSPDVDGYLDLARTFMRRRRQTSAPVLMSYAEDAVRAALSIDPDHVDAVFLLGLTEQYEHLFERAAQTALRVISLAPARPDGYHLLGDARLELGRYDEAIKAYQSAMDRRPDLRAYNRAAYISWLHGQDEAAVRLLEMALDAGSGRDPEAAAWCFVDLGEVHRHRGEMRLATNAAEQALLRIEAYVPALTLRARARAAEGADAAALEDYRAVLSRLPTAETLLETAELLERLGEPARAAYRRKQARALAESDPRPYAHDLARRAVSADEALRFARAELKTRQGVFAWDTYGLALVRGGRFDEAERAFARANVLATPRADFTVHRALLAAVTDRAGDAKAYLVAALEQDPHVDPRMVKEVRALLARPQKDESP